MGFMNCIILTRFLEDFSHAFYEMSNVLLESLLYDTLKMAARVTETCRCNRYKCIAEHLLKCAFLCLCKKINCAVYLTAFDVRVTGDKDIELNRCFCTSVCGYPTHNR
jgi:hypothetical protein